MTIFGRHFTKVLSKGKYVRLSLECAHHPRPLKCTRDVSVLQLAEEVAAKRLLAWETAGAGLDVRDHFLKGRSQLLRDFAHADDKALMV